MARGFNYAPGASAEVQVAQQPGLHRTHIAALGASRNHLVRGAIALRPDCPFGLMVTLAHDYSAEVRANVASNPSVQHTVMAYLATDRSVAVVTALISNPSLPAEILDELAFHRKRDVRAAAAARLDGSQPIAVTMRREDFHTPEVAEHVAPIEQRMTADGSIVSPFVPVNVVAITTGAPIAAFTTQPAAASGPTPTEWPTQPPQPVTQAAAVPQIFAPHSTPDAPAPTRTAPVRGFKPKP